MARLVKCQTCGADVDSMADVCYQCGRKNPAIGLVHYLLALLGLVILVLVCIAMS